MSDQNNFDPSQNQPFQPPEKPWYLKKRFWAIGAGGLLILGSIATTGNAGDSQSGETNQSQLDDSSSDIADETNDTSTDSTDSSTEVVEEEPAPETEPVEPSMTLSQENAVATAQDYLDYAAFSRKGLIEQLEFEKYSTADATFAVDYLAPDWNEQAAKAAQEYLDYSSFSRQGLIDQLVFEGYTQQQATYGVNQAGL